MSLQQAVTLRSSEIRDPVTLAIRGVSLLSTVHRLLLEDEAGVDEMRFGFGRPRRERLLDALDEAIAAAMRIRERVE